MSKLKKGDTYCTLWTTNLSGPFVYDGEKNILHNACIKTDQETIRHANNGIDLLMELHDVGEDSAVKFIDIFSDETIDAELSNWDKSWSLEALKKLAPRIREVLGEGK